MNTLNKISKKAVGDAPAFGLGVALGAGLSYILAKRRAMSPKGIKEGTATVSEIATRHPATVTEGTDLSQVARLMVECDCGAIPVVDQNEQRVVGIITDRDIVVRSVAIGRSPTDLLVEDCMTLQTITIPQTATIEECCALMEEFQVRRIPVVDENEKCVGIVSQADIAIYASPFQTTEMVREVSRPDLTNARFRVA